MPTSERQSHALTALCHNSNNSVSCGACNLFGSAHFCRVKYQQRADIALGHLHNHSERVSLCSRSTLYQHSSGPHLSHSLNNVVILAAVEPRRLSLVLQTQDTRRQSHSSRLDTNCRYNDLRWTELVRINVEPQIKNMILTFAPRT